MIDITTMGPWGDDRRWNLIWNVNLKDALRAGRTVDVNGEHYDVVDPEPPTTPTEPSPATLPAPEVHYLDSAQAAAYPARVEHVETPADPRGDADVTGTGRSAPPGPEHDESLMTGHQGIAAIPADLDSWPEGCIDSDEPHRTHPSTTAGQTVHRDGPSTVGREASLARRSHRPPHSTLRRRPIRCCYSGAR